MKKYIAENFLYHIWDEQHLKDTIRTVAGTKIEILFQGKWNTDAGPDFINSIILFDGKKLQGDVEIHKHEYDWKAHNHHEDKNYNNVILHVVFTNDQNAEFTISESGNKIPILELQLNLDEQIDKLWKRYGQKPFDTSQQKTIECLLVKDLHYSNVLKRILLSLGKERFLKKCKRFSAELYNSDFNQIFYEGIIEALGYGKNKIPFFKLAKLLPFQELKTFMNECKDFNDIFCILLFKGGFDLHDYNFSFVDEKLLQRFDKIRSRFDAKLHRTLQKDDWNFFRCRPQNHPVNRLWQIAPFICSALKQGNLINSIIALFSYGDTQTIDARKIEADFSNLLSQEDHPSIGSSRCRDIFSNIILPVCYVYAQTLRYDTLQNMIFKVYGDLPKLSENYITHYMHTLLKDGIHFRINLQMQQGMIQLYYQFCAQHECDNCVANLK
ncbi:MAG: DUF2851 family protein [Candidatus Celaenobacter polaris]|nr:DUF2851 family protein [Candidatus Celaenobacter polaris]